MAQVIEAEFNSGNYRKFGEISALLSAEKPEFYLNCGFCEFTYLQLQDFIQHIYDNHLLELPRNYIKDTLNAPLYPQEYKQENFRLENIDELTIKEEINNDVDLTVDVDAEMTLDSEEASQSIRQSETCKKNTKHIIDVEVEDLDPKKEFSEADKNQIMQQNNLNCMLKDSPIQQEITSSQALYLMQPSPSTTTSLDSATSSAIQLFINDACQKAAEKVEERNNLILLRLMEEIQGLRKGVGVLQKTVSQNNSTILPNKPFSTVDDFLQFEQAVQEDVDKFSLLKADLKRISSSNSRKFVTKSWQKLMHDNVAESFSWRGTTDKKCIRAFTVATAIRQTFTCDNGGKEEDFVFASKSFFQYAKNRIKIKAARENTMHLSF